MKFLSRASVKMEGDKVPFPKHKVGDYIVKKLKVKQTFGELTRWSNIRPI